MVDMGSLTVVARNLVDVAADNGRWMTWNLILAVLVFRHRGPRTAVWWTGAALFGLFLPNAPYVVTDLVHLRDDVVAADTELAVITAVLPAYASFIAVGLLAYVLAVGEMGRYLTGLGLGRWRGQVEVATHALCAVGVVLGRVAGLNSWEPVTEPHGAAERIVLTLSWRGGPFAGVRPLALILGWPRGPPGP